MEPQSYLSIITDGMAQSHCQLPWLGNLSSFNKSCLPQHIQGVMMHGRKILLFRTFHNLSNTANLQIHTFLLTLEWIEANEGTIAITDY